MRQSSGLASQIARSCGNLQDWHHKSQDHAAIFRIGITSRKIMRQSSGLASQIARSCGYLQGWHHKSQDNAAIFRIGITNRKIDRKSTRLNSSNLGISSAVL